MHYFKQIIDALKDFVPGVASKLEIATLDTKEINNEAFDKINELTKMVSNYLE